MAKQKLLLFLHTSTLEIYMYFKYDFEFKLYFMYQLVGVAFRGATYQLLQAPGHFSKQLLVLRCLIHVAKFLGTQGNPPQVGQWYPSLQLCSLVLKLTFLHVCFFR